MPVPQATRHWSAVYAGIRRQMARSSPDARLSRDRLHTCARSGARFEEQCDQMGRTASKRRLAVEPQSAWLTCTEHTNLATSRECTWGLARESVDAWREPTARQRAWRRAVAAALYSE